MSALVLYQYAGCSTCRKATRWLEEAGIEVEGRPITEAPPSAALLARLHRASGLPIGRLFNSSGESYRAGNFKARRPSMSDAECYDAFAADGKLIRRPILISAHLLNDDEAPSGTTTVALIGFREAEWRAALL